MVKEDNTAATNTTTAPVDNKDVKEVLYGDANQKAKDTVPEKVESKEEKPAGETKSEEQKETKDYTLEASKNSLLDKESVEKIALYAKERGLSHEDAKALLDSYEETLTGFETKNKTQLEEDTLKTKQMWVDTLKNDPVFGGANFAKNVALAQTGAKHVFDQETMDFLDQSGLGNFPGLVKGLKKVGEMLANDTFILGSTAKPQKQKSLEELFYGGQKN